LQQVLSPEEKSNLVTMKKAFEMNVLLKDERINDLENIIKLNCLESIKVNDNLLELEEIQTNYEIL